MTLNLDGLSLMAFATPEVLQKWRNEVQETERNKEQRLVQNSYTKIAHTNVPHTDVAHTNVAHTDVAHTNIAARDSYNQVFSPNYYQYSQHTQTSYYYKDSSYYNYAQYVQRYATSGDYTRAYYYYNGKATTNSRSYVGRTYTKSYNQTGGYGKYAQTHVRSHNSSLHYTAYYKNYYTQYTRLSSNYTAYPVYTQYYYQSYSRQTANYGQYSQTLSYGQYTRAAYQQVAYRQVPYSQVAYREVAYRQSAERNIGFDHMNYVPSAPELYEIEGKVFCNDVKLHLASYDKNRDGVGSQDQNSLDIYYIVKLRQIYDMNGNAINGTWQTIMDGEMTEDKDVDISMYADGIYEISTQAYNKPRTENGVTATYVSDENIFTFTIQNGAIDNDLTIINANEFEKYAYGLETYLTTGNEIRKYLENVIYANAPSGQEKGLFLELDIDSRYDNLYHKVYVGLEKGSTSIAADYGVLMQTDANGDQKAGDKTGVVFIPLSDMLDDGCFDDVNIIMKQEVYLDKECTNKLAEEDKIIGLNQAKSVVYIDLDGERPQATISSPATSMQSKQVVTATYSDVGKGVGGVYYQVVDKDSPIDEGAWKKADSSAGALSMTLSTPGDFDVYVKVIDKVGNETIASQKGFHIATAITSLECPRYGTITKKIRPVGTVITDMAITKVEFWLQDYIPVQGGTLIETSGEGSIKTYKYNTVMTIPVDIPQGKHVVFFRTTFEDGTVKTVSKSIDISDKIAGNLLSYGVYHTDKWEGNRQYFNSKVDPLKQRDSNIFWAGEKFIIKNRYLFEGNVQLDERCLIKEVEIVNATKKDGSKYVLSFENYINNKDYEHDLESAGLGIDGEETFYLNQTGEIWDAEMLNRWARGEYELTFRFTTVGGDVYEQEIVISNNPKFYTLHRVK